MFLHVPHENGKQDLHGGWIPYKRYPTIKPTNGLQWFCRMNSSTKMNERNVSEKKKRKLRRFSCVFNADVTHKLFFQRFTQMCTTFLFRWLFMPNGFGINVSNLWVYIEFFFSFSILHFQSKNFHWKTFIARISPRSGGFEERNNQRIEIFSFLFFLLFVVYHVQAFSILTMRKWKTHTQ